MIDSKVNQYKTAYANNPQGLAAEIQQSGGQNLYALLAMQDMKSQLEAKARQYQMAMQDGGTIADQRENELRQLTQQEMAEKMGMTMPPMRPPGPPGAMPPQGARPPQGAMPPQGAAPPQQAPGPQGPQGGAPQGIGGLPMPNIQKGFAEGGVVGFNGLDGSLVDERSTEEAVADLVAAARMGQIDLSDPQTAEEVLAAQMLNDSPSPDGSSLSPRLQERAGELRRERGPGDVGGLSPRLEERLAELKPEEAEAVADDAEEAEEEAEASPARTDNSRSVRNIRRGQRPEPKEESGDESSILDMLPQDGPFMTYHNQVSKDYEDLPSTLAGAGEATRMGLGYFPAIVDQMYNSAIKPAGEGIANFGRGMLGIEGEADLGENPILTGMNGTDGIGSLFEDGTGKEVNNSAPEEVPETTLVDPKTTGQKEAAVEETVEAAPEVEEDDGFLSREKRQRLWRFMQGAGSNPYGGVSFNNGMNAVRQMDALEEARQMAASEAEYNAEQDRLNRNMEYDKMSIDALSKMMAAPMATMEEAQMAWNNSMLRMNTAAEDMAEVQAKFLDEYPGYRNSRAQLQDLQMAILERTMQVEDITE